MRDRGRLLFLQLVPGLLHQNACLWTIASQEGAVKTRGKMLLDKHCCSMQRSFSACDLPPRIYAGVTAHQR